MTLSKFSPIIEVCAFSLESCLTAQQGGAKRVELCAGIYEGGTTPSAGLISLAKQQTSIEIHAMIRPRGGDFCYSDDEIEVMKADIQMVKSLTCDGIVLGILQKDGRVNIAQTKELVDLAKPLQVTFHRAIDMARDYFEALEDIIEAGCHRILTSGQKNTAMEGVKDLTELVKRADGRIQIMAGSGVNVQNAQTLASTGVNALHLTGKSSRDSEMVYRKEGIAMGGLSEVPEYDIVYSDADKIRAVVDLF
ncbi:copper homeostasis protein CutC [Arcicella sp. LKC2W]|uniref:copper homeostasis protein CutC n=1 Tax=Arcicella sp. LKC2W TaxID=2984198 RepID=UPI002B1FA0F9|nr:copper homeostasis protein CutC [Arcicella sp. LKC2W]MEA5458297.1 copper homeostasis protein CutC [Arcicella sp. LKC2W]